MTRQQIRSTGNQWQLRTGADDVATTGKDSDLNRLA
jgi:hypothetical protein